MGCPTAANGLARTRIVLRTDHARLGLILGNESLSVIGVNVEFWAAALQLRNGACFLNASSTQYNYGHSFYTTWLSARPEGMSSVKGHEF